MVVSKATRGPIEAVVEAVGEARPVRDAELAAEAVGTVVWIADEGATLARGSVVARLAPDRMAAQAAAAEARSFSTSADAAQRRRDLERTRRLHAEGVASRAELEAAEASAEAATARERADRSSAQEVARWLDEKVIRAPFDGVVLDKLAEIGEVLGPGAAIARFGDVSTLEVAAWVGEAEALHVKKNAPASVAFDAEAGETHAAVVHRVDRALSPGARTAEVVVRISNAAGRLPAGLMARVRMKAERRDDALRVPLIALRTGPDGDAVWIVDAQSRVRRRGVRLGLRNTDSVEILEGLAVGDAVIVRGGESVGEGDLVEAGVSTP